MRNMIDRVAPLVFTALLIVGWQFFGPGVFIGFAIGIAMTLAAVYLSALE
jgi:hypothetical protein